jgi:hypothetical protein
MARGTARVVFETASGAARRLVIDLFRLTQGCDAASVLSAPRRR